MRISRVLLALCAMLLHNAGMFADNYTDADGIVWTYTVTDVTTLDGDTVNGARITQIMNNGKTVVIPENINGIAVVAIGTALKVDNKEDIVSLATTMTCLIQQKKTSTPCCHKRKN